MYMSEKNIVFLFALFCYTSCDIGTNLLVNGHPELRLVNDCGGITMTGFAFEPDRIKIEFNGKFSVCTDSLRIKKRGIPVPDSEIMFYLDSVELKDKRPFSLDGKSVLRIFIRQIPSLNYGRNGTIELLPSNFILCNGKPVINDTINFNCKLIKRKRSSSP